jgi:putative restriction endonuclease
VPVHIPGSSDLTNNGLALCPSHHAAYDIGLLGVAPNYHVSVNQAKLNDLRAQGFHGGEETILQMVCNTIIIPSQPADRPNPEYLQRGMQIRGWLGYLG